LEKKRERGTTPGAAISAGGDAKGKRGLKSKEGVPVKLERRNEEKRRGNIKNHIERKLRQHGERMVDFT